MYLGFSGEVQPGQVTGAIHAVRAPSSGTEASAAWTADLGAGRVSASPTLGDDGTIYAVGGPGRLTAISPAGQIKWTAQVGPAVKGSPGNRLRWHHLLSQQRRKSVRRGTTERNGYRRQCAMGI